MPLASGNCYAPVTHGHTWSHMFTCHASVCQGSDPKYAPSDACSRSRRASVARGPALLPPPAGSHAVAAPCNEADRATASHPAPAPAPLPPPRPPVPPASQPPWMPSTVPPPQQLPRLVGSAAERRAASLPVSTARECGGGACAPVWLPIAMQLPRPMPLTPPPMPLPLPPVPVMLPLPPSPSHQPLEPPMPLVSAPPRLAPPLLLPWPTHSASPSSDANSMLYSVHRCGAAGSGPNSPHAPASSRHSRMQGIAADAWRATPAGGAPLRDAWMTAPADGYDMPTGHS
mmetsp:Transcript_37806/g.111911  ORF Transcript_37806/g.111911 Transcript_37806/m.111911 type:complete len:287 (-) Transcript_37806:137-997(-)